MWVHLIFASTGATGHCWDGFVVLGGVKGQPSSDSAWGGTRGRRVLAQSAHQLLSGGGRGLYSSHTSLSLSFYHTSHKHSSLRCVCSERALNAAPPPSLFLRAEWAIAWPERWLHARGLCSTDQTPASCVWLHMLSSPPPPRGALCICPAVDGAIPRLGPIWHQWRLQ